MECNKIIKNIGIKMGGDMGGWGEWNEDGRWINVHWCVCLCAYNITKKIEYSSNVYAREYLYLCCVMYPPPMIEIMYFIFEEIIQRRLFKAHINYIMHDLFLFYIAWLQSWFWWFIYGVIKFTTFFLFYTRKVIPNCVPYF